MIRLLRNSKGEKRSIQIENDKLIIRFMSPDTLYRTHYIFHVGSVLSYIKGGSVIVTTDLGSR